MTQTKAELLETKHQGDIRLGDANSSHYVGLKAPATVASNLIWTLPATDGTSNQFLKTDGSGNLSWGTDSATDNTKMPLAGGTFTGDVTFDGATAGRDIVFDRSDNALEFADSAKIILGSAAAGDCQLLHDGTDTFIQNKTGNLRIANNVGGDVGGDIVIQAMNTEDSIKCIHDGAVELYFNNSKKLQTYSGGVEITGSYLFHGDGVETRWGGASDLRIYHSGSESHIADEGTGGLTISGGTLTFKNQARDETHATMTVNGGVELFYDNTSKFKTTSTGVEVDGRIDGKTGGHLDIRTLSAHSIQLRTNNTLRLNLQSDGHLVPYLNNTYDLGLTGTRFRNIYAETLYGSGANLTNLPASGSTFTATASGAIAQGKPVIMNTNGTVTQVEGIYTRANPTMVAGAGTGTNSNNMMAISFDPNTNRGLWVYQHDANSCRAYSYQVNDGSDSSWGSGAVGACRLQGSELTINSSGYASHHWSGASCTYIGNNRHMVVFQNGATSLQACIVTVSASDGSITKGSTSTVVSGNIHHWSSGAANVPGQSKVVIAYQDFDNNRGYVLALGYSGSGTGIGSGSAVSVPDSKNMWRSAVEYDPDTTRVVVMGSQITGSESYSAQTKGFVLSVSGYSLTLGSWNEGSNAYSYYVRLVYDTTNNKMIFIANSGASSIDMRVLTVSNSANSYTYESLTNWGNSHFGHSIGSATAIPSWYSAASDRWAVTVRGPASNYEPEIHTFYYNASATGKISFSHKKTAISGYGTNPQYGDAIDTVTDSAVLALQKQPWPNRQGQIQGVKMSTDGSNQSSSNFAGFAESAISNGNSGTIQAVGAVLENQSGLTPASRYYVKNDGTLTTTASASTSKGGGMAIASDKLFITNIGVKGDQNY